MVPAGVELGSGVKTAATPRVMIRGSSPTEKEYDVAVRGEGFFRIRLPDGRTAYTRDGSFDLDARARSSRATAICSIPASPCRRMPTVSRSAPTGP